MVASMKNVKQCGACNSKLEQDNVRFCPHCGENLSQQSGSKVVVDCLLPINIKYKEVADPKIENPSTIRISRVALDLYPYYIFDYALNMTRKDPSSKSHKLKNEGKHVVDAIIGQLIAVHLSTTTELKSLLHNLVFKNEKDSSQELQLSNKSEREQIIEDLNNFAPVYNYVFNLTEEYSINIIDEKTTLKISEKAVLKRIKEDNSSEISYRVKGTNDKTKEEKMYISPTYSEIKILRKYLLYVPVWRINFKAGRMTYDRKVLAASNKIIIDDISACHKHSFFGKILRNRKRTYALCEICGVPLCYNHALKKGDSYFCEEDFNGKNIDRATNS
jgi:hypothetical protein